MICQICNKELKNKKALTSHNWRSHTKEGLEHIKKINKPYKEGRKAWNLGLTKETNSIIKKSAELYSNKVKLGELIPYWKNKKHSIESKIKIGKKLSKNNKGGRCKWFEVCNNFGIKFKAQGSWEKDFSTYLNLIDDNWIKIGVGHKKHSFKWKDHNGKIHYYTPDFWSTKLQKYFEVKGHWWGNDRLKMKLVLEQNNIDLEIVDRDIFNQYMKKTKI